MPDLVDTRSELLDTLALYFKYILFSFFLLMADLASKTCAGSFIYYFFGLFHIISNA